MGVKLWILSALAALAAQVSAQCDCSGGVVGGKCYKTVAAAVDAAPSGSTIQIGGTNTISKEIVFAKDLKFEGVTCKGKKATFAANFNIKNNEYGMFRVLGPGERTVSWNNFVFTRAAGSGQSAGIRVGVLFSRERTTPYTEEEKFPATVKVTNCDFTDLRTYAMGGSSIFVHLAKSVDIANSNTFTKNINEDSGRRFGGGGTVWISHIPLGGKVSARGTYSDNEHLFEHGVSAGVFADKVEGTIEINGKFYRNRASDGAAIHIFRPVSSAYVDINGVYEDNEAVEMGDGSRGGAIRFQNVESPVLIQGTYINNRAPGGRGGVIASNRFYRTGEMLIRGTFINNYAGASGGVFDQIAGSKADGYQYIFEKGASLTLDGSSVFKGNSARNEATSILNIGAINATLSQADWVPGKTYRYVGTEPYIPE